MTSPVLLHLLAVPIDDVDGGSLAAKMQEAEHDGDGELPVAAGEGAMQQPADDGRIVAALPQMRGRNDPALIVSLAETSFCMR